MSLELLALDPLPAAMVGDAYTLVAVANPIGGLPLRFKSKLLAATSSTPVATTPAAGAPSTVAVVAPLVVKPGGIGLDTAGFADLPTAGTVALLDGVVLNQAGGEIGAPLSLVGALFRRTPAPSRTITLAAGAAPATTTATLRASDNDRVVLVTGVAGSLAVDGTVTDGFRCVVDNQTLGTLTFGGFGGSFATTGLPPGQNCSVTMAGSTVKALYDPVQDVASLPDEAILPATAFRVVSDGGALRRLAEGRVPTWANDASRPAVANGQAFWGVNISRGGPEIGISTGGTTLWTPMTMGSSTSTPTPTPTPTPSPTATPTPSPTPTPAPTYPALTLTNPTFAAGKYSQGSNGGSGVSGSISSAGPSKSFGFWLGGAGSGINYKTLFTLDNVLSINVVFGNLALNGSSSGGGPSIGDGAAHWIYAETNGGNPGAAIYVDGTIVNNGGANGSGSPTTLHFDMANFGGGVISDLTLWSSPGPGRAAPPTASLAGATSGTYGADRIVTWKLDGNGAGA